MKTYLKDRNWTDGLWELALPHALHLKRSLLCETTGSSPHDRMFGFTRKSSGFQPEKDMPDWLSEPGPALLKNFSRTSKNDPIVQQVELVDSNPLYAWIKKENGKEQTLSTRHLARMPRNGLTSPLEK